MIDMDKHSPFEPTSPRRRLRACLPLLAVLCTLAGAGAAQAQAPAKPAPPAAAAKDDSAIVLVGKDGWLFPAWGSLSDVDMQAVDASTRLIAEAKARLAARGIRLELLLLPDKVLFYEDRLPEGKVVSASVEKRYDTLLGSLQKAGVEALDARKVLAGVHAAGSDVFYRSDQHWTQAAADATADALAARIKQAVPNLAGEPGSGTRWARKPVNAAMATWRNCSCRRNSVPRSAARPSPSAASRNRRVCSTAARPRCT